MRTQTLIPLLVFAAYCITPIARADTVVYKWIDQHGVASFSDTAPDPKDGHHVTTMTVQTMPASERRAANRMLLNLKKEEEKSFKAQQRRLKIADENIEKAIIDLKEAEHNLAVESVPTGYDRVGMVNHRARLRESYFERVSVLQEQVDRARQALTDAYTARDEIVPE